MTRYKPAAPRAALGLAATAMAAATMAMMVVVPAELEASVPPATLEAAAKAAIAEAFGSDEAWSAEREEHAARTLQCTQEDRT